MISTEQWRASIGLYHSGSYRQLVRIVGKRQWPSVTAYQLLWPLFSVLALLVQTLFVVWTSGPCMLLFKEGLTCFVISKKRTTATQLLVWVCALSITIMEDACTNLERSLVAMAILLIMSGDVEQNPGPIGQTDIKTVSEYLSTLSEVDLLTLGMALGLSLTTVRGYGRVSVTEYRYSLLGDWVNEKDSVKECGGATWSSLVNALRSKEVSQNGIAATIEAEQMRGDQEKLSGQKHLTKASTYLSTLSEVDLLMLGMELGLSKKTLRGYGKVSVPEYCHSMLGDWMNEKDSVKECGGATWNSLVNALKSEEVNQNGIATKIEAEQMGGGQEEQAGQKHLTKASEYLSTLSEVDLLMLGMELGLSKKTLRGYGKVSVLEYCHLLLGDWMNEKDSVKECGGATWSSLVNALRSEEVSQNEIAAKIEAEQMGGGQEEQAGDTPPQSVNRFTDYLRAFYQTAQPTECNKWPPSPSKKYINLAAISREKVSREELKKFTIATLHGNVDDIVEIKAPIKIQVILDKKPGEKLECVLIEGAPGVGKTTIAWEICKQWAKRELFQHYSTVILLTLRGETVQKAKCIKDLIFYNDEVYKEEVARHLKQTDGKDTLIILEGLDELPKHLITQSSIFTSLLSGTELPQATILITSRPSATVQLWNKWKKRMSRHIEVLGFTKQDLNDYILSVMSPEELPAFIDYLSLNSNIKLMMYIPIHAAIVIETYRYCHRYSRLLPTSITELYTCLVQTILLRYLDTHPHYKHKEIAIRNFDDLPLPVYQTFQQLMEMALQGILNQQLIFPDQQKQIEHMGFMDVVAECIPHMRLVTYSYNFLHASVQEYLAAYAISLKTTEEQEQLLQRIHTERYLQNTGRFLAGITKFKDMDKATVKAIIEKGCETVETNDGGTQLRLSSYTLQLINESGNWNIIAGYSSYYCQFTDYNPLLDFSNLGHSIANSSYTWTLRLGDQFQYMQSLERIDMLLNPLKKHSNPTYAIEFVDFCYDTPQCVERLLMGLPQIALQQVRELAVVGNAENGSPLPVAVFELILSMISRLNKLWLVRTSIGDSGATTIAEMLQRNSTLTHLDISENVIKDSGATAIAEMLQRNSTLMHLDISDNTISDSGATAIAEMLQRNLTLTYLNISGNAINDSGATAIAEMLKHNTLEVVNLEGNKFSAEGRKALEKVRAIKKYLRLYC